MAKSDPKTITDVLKQAIRGSGLTRYRIAAETGVPATSLLRFMRGETSLRLDKADAIAEYLGVVAIKKTKGK
jgi:transcriptional regulator with XRE-family HTH domain